MLVSFEGTEGLVATDEEFTPIPLRQGFALSVQHWARAIPSNRVRTIGYQYQVLHNADPLIDFHYHPRGLGDEGRVPYCHTHVTLEDKSWPNFRKLHIPSCRLAFEDVLMLLVEDFRLPAKDGAIEALLRQRRRFENGQTWFGRQGPP
jgi:hypothetical protein